MSTYKHANLPVLVTHAGTDFSISKMSCRRATFEQLCAGKSSGYVLETGVEIRFKSMTEAIEMTSGNMDHRMNEIECSLDRHIESFYIGKSHIRRRANVDFNPSNPNTWRLAHGVNARHRIHVDQGRCKDGLVVVAVVTKDSILEGCRQEKYITHQEEYALILEKRLIQEYKAKKKPRLLNKGTDPGGTDKTESIGYLIYFCYTLGGKLEVEGNWDMSADQT